MNPPRITNKKGHATALDQSALLELLELLNLAGVDDRIRSATETLYQALIEAELTAAKVDIAKAFGMSRFQVARLLEQARASGVRRSLGWAAAGDADGVLAALGSPPGLGGTVRGAGMDASADTLQKALQINLDPRWYGTIAEIGAGQEVARWFFRAGGAAGTVAKSMSAYDMAVSDAVYGKADRYVSKGRLQAMLDHEFELNLERLGDERGDETAFFAFADTVVARSYRGGTNAWAGWA